MRRKTYDPQIIAARDRMAARHATSVQADPISLPCRVVPAVEDSWELQQQTFFWGPVETVPAVYDLWCYVADEKPAPATPALYSDLGTLTSYMPHGSLWAALPAVVYRWFDFQLDMQKSMPFPRPSARPTLATLARGHLLSWWWSLEPQERYRDALRMGLLPGGPTTPIATLQGWHAAEFNLLPPAPAAASDKHAFVRFLQYHRWNLNIASTEWERSGQTVPPGLDAELVETLKVKAA